MAEVIYNSLQYLNDTDTRAMAVYLKSLAAGRPADTETSAVSRAGEQPAAAFRPNRLRQRIAQAATGPTAAACRPNTRPWPAIPRSRWNSAVNPIRMVLNGGFPPGTAGNPMPYGMPPFAQTLSDDEVAAVVTYIRGLGQSRCSRFGTQRQRTAQGAAGLAPR